MDGFRRQGDKHLTPELRCTWFQTGCQGPSRSQGPFPCREKSYHPGPRVIPTRNLQHTFRYNQEIRQRWQKPAEPTETETGLQNLKSAEPCDPANRMLVLCYNRFKDTAFEPGNSIREFKAARRSGGRAAQAQREVSAEGLEVRTARRVRDRKHVWQEWTAGERWLEGESRKEGPGQVFWVLREFGFHSLSQRKPSDDLERPSDRT